MSVPGRPPNRVARVAAIALELDANNRLYEEAANAWRTPPIETAK